MAEVSSISKVKGRIAFIKKDKASILKIKKEAFAVWCCFIMFVLHKKHPTMMATLAFKSDNQGQLQLLPPSLDELIPSTHVVCVVSSTVDHLGLSGILQSHKGVTVACIRVCLIDLSKIHLLNSLHKRDKMLDLCYKAA